MSETPLFPPKQPSAVEQSGLDEFWDCYQQLQQMLKSENQRLDLSIWLPENKTIRGAWRSNNPIRRIKFVTKQLGHIEWLIRRDATPEQWKIPLERYTHSLAQFFYGNYLDQIATGLHDPYQALGFVRLLGFQASRLTDNAKPAALHQIDLVIVLPDGATVSGQPALDYLTKCPPSDMFQTSGYNRDSGMLFLTYYPLQKLNPTI
ncbi:hypothetical protein KGQ71_04895 [Patescibacteria group bacterium]|nr:hypothetical protein [Patescibacteria group bacterium]